MGSNRVIDEDISSTMTVLGIVIAAAHSTTQSDTHSTRLRRADTIQRECEEFLRALQMRDLNLIRDIEDAFVDGVKDNLEACRRYLEDPEIRASAMSAEYKHWQKISIELTALLQYLQRFRQHLADIPKQASPSLYPPRSPVVARPSSMFTSSTSNGNGNAPHAAPVTSQSYSRPGLVNRFSQEFANMSLSNATNPNSMYDHRDSNRQSIDAPQYVSSGHYRQQSTSPISPHSSSHPHHYTSRHSINIPHTAPIPIYSQSNNSHQSTIYAQNNSSRQSLNMRSHSPVFVQTPPSSNGNGLRSSLYGPDAPANGSSTYLPQQQNSIYRVPYNGSQPSLFSPPGKDAVPAKGILKKFTRRFSEGAVAHESSPPETSNIFSSGAARIHRSWSTTATVGGSLSRNGDERGRRPRPPAAGSERYGLERFSPTNDLFTPPDLQTGSYSRYPDFANSKEVRRQRSSSLVRDSSAPHANGHKHEASEHKSSSKKHEKSHSKRKEKDKDKDKDNNHRHRD